MLTAYMSFELRERGRGLTESDLLRMLDLGLIGMHGFQFCTLTEARDCRERMEMEKRRKLRKADAS